MLAARRPQGVILICSTVVSPVHASPHSLGFFFSKPFIICLDISYILTYLLVRFLLHQIKPNITHSPNRPYIDMENNISPIKIRVGSQTFETTKATLLEAPYFKGYFSEAIGTKPGADGVYFLDMKGDVFEYSTYETLESRRQILRHIHLRE